MDRLTLADVIVEEAVVRGVGRTVNVSDRLLGEISQEDLIMAIRTTPVPTQSTGSVQPASAAPQRFEEVLPTEDEQE